MRAAEGANTAGDDASTRGNGFEFEASSIHNDKSALVEASDKLEFVAHVCRGLFGPVAGRSRIQPIRPESVGLGRKEDKAVAISCCGSWLRGANGGHCSSEADREIIDAASRVLISGTN